MKPTLPVRLARLVRRTRNRLWLEQLRDILWLALWAVAVVVAAGAIGRWWLGIPERGTIALLAALPLITSLLIAARRRPTLDEAANAADTRASAESLLLSAWDLLYRDGPHPAARTVVLARAERALDEWERVLTARDSDGTPRRFWLPLFAILALLPLLTLDRPAPSRDHATANDHASAGVTDREPQGTSLTTLIEDLRRTGSDRRPMGHDNQISAHSPWGPDAVPRDMGPNAVAEVAAPTAGKGLSSGRDEVAGTGAAPPDPAAPERTVPSVPEVTVEVLRRGTASNLDSGSGADLTPTRGIVAHSPGDTAPPPAVLPARMRHDRTALDPSQRALADRYFALWPKKEDHD